MKVSLEWASSKLTHREQLLVWLMFEGSVESRILFKRLLVIAIRFKVASFFQFGGFNIF